MTGASSNVESNSGAILAAQADIKTYTDGLEALIGSSNTALATLAALYSALNAAIAQNDKALTVRAISGETLKAQGLLAGYSIINKFGRNGDVDAAEDVWNGGGFYTGFPTGAAEKVTIVSADAKDASGGTGARTVKITGLDANYDVLSETITMNGTTPVDSVGTYSRVNQAYVVTAGSDTHNMGELTVAHKVTTANIFIKMPAQSAHSHVAAYTIPNGYVGYLKNYSSWCSDLTSNHIDMALYLRNFGEAARTVRPWSTDTSSAGSNVLVYGGLLLPAKSDIAIRCTAVQNTNAIVTAAFDILLAKV